MEQHYDLHTGAPEPVAPRARVSAPPTTRDDGSRTSLGGGSRARPLAGRNGNGNGNGHATVDVALVDPHELDRRGIECLMENYEHYRVVVDAPDASEGRRAVLAEHPDVVVLGGDAHGPDVLAFVNAVHGACPETGFLVLREAVAIEDLRSWLHAGVRGVLLRTCSVEELEHALSSVAEGGRYLADELATMLQRDRGASDRQFVLSRLTKREQEVLGLLADGHSAKAIARKLGLSSKTIDSHRQNVTRKLEVGSLAELVKYAVAAELSSPSPRDVPAVESHHASVAGDRSVAAP